jgi:hypothetical protein
MISGDKSNEERRAVEALAQSLYEAQDQGGIAWAKRTLVIRERGFYWPAGNDKQPKEIYHYENKAKMDAGQ